MCWMHFFPHNTFANWSLNILKHHFLPVDQWNNVKPYARLRACTRKNHWLKKNCSKTSKGTLIFLLISYFKNGHGCLQIHLTKKQRACCFITFLSADSGGSLFFFCFGCNVRNLVDTLLQGETKLSFRGHFLLYSNNNRIHSQTSTVAHRGQSVNPCMIKWTQLKKGETTLYILTAHHF